MVESLGSPFVGRLWSRWSRGVAAGAVVLALAACGGSSSDPCGLSLTCSSSDSGSGPDTTASQAKISLALVNGAGAVTTQVGPEQPGVLRAVVTSAAGQAVSGVPVIFTTTDTTGRFNPSSGSALTDATGTASVGLPAGSLTGAFTVTANAVVSGASVQSSVGYAVRFPTLTLSAMAITPATVSAGGTAGLSVTVLSDGAPFTAAQSVTFTSACAAAGKAAISSPVVTLAGVATTSYTDKGCGGPDVIMASTTVGDATATVSGTVTALAPAAGQIAFVSALPQNLALKGTGGPGRQETSTVTFKVLDASGNPVSGSVVDFVLFSSATSAAGTGGTTLNQLTATSGAGGLVTTIVQAGIVNTPVRVSATLRGTAVTSISDQLVVSTGIPDQNSFSLSTETYNVEGMNIDGCEPGVGSLIRVSLADHFNNPVPDGTAVSFTAEGGVVDASCLTGMANTQLVNGAPIQQSGVPGVCTVRFCAANPRPANGRVTVMAYALGEEHFVDDPARTNGVNRYDAGETYQDLCEPFRNDRALVDSQANSTIIDAKSGAACPAPEAGEPYIDTNGDGSFTNVGDVKYSGVLNVDPATGQTIAESRTPTVHVRGSLVQVLSYSAAAITSVSADPIQLDSCIDGTKFVNAPRVFGVAVRDINPTVFPGNSLPGNILPAGTTIKFTASNGLILGKSEFKVENTNAVDSAAWTYFLSVQSDASQTGPGTVSNGVQNPSYVCTNTVSNGQLTVEVTTPSGVTSTRSFTVTD